MSYAPIGLLSHHLHILGSNFELNWYLHSGIEAKFKIPKNLSALYALIDDYTLTKNVHSDVICTENKNVV